MKENLNTGLLVLIALMVGYGTFVKDDSAESSPVSNNAQIANIQQNTKPNQNQDYLAQTQINNNGQPGVAATPVNPPTAIVFAENKHDFGKINQNTKNRKLFTFTNSGSNPLIIENAKGSCGCTVPKYPKEPIPPGGTGEIEVVYSPGKQKGNQTKSVTITANTEPRLTTLQITANVEEVKEESGS